MLTYAPEVPCHRPQFLFFNVSFVDNIINIAINDIVCIPIFQSLYI